ncbi:VC0807 family protein [Rubellicoccus peritrichatus]|uniref:VC0807 family protein n=1 Tax=Rubellicoccus peritrichatus TaxID=3080537 RepID=A0AAQ3QXB8_9BACT|nr:VC0807 family protein [Puniceicoccus sp. CR14]WOO43518.1 VC0807 family protein [Puniceicoccus sp. CR14]
MKSDTNQRGSNTILFQNQLAKPARMVVVATMSETAPKRENMWANLGFNIILPMLLLSKGEAWLSSVPPWGVLIIALAFPIGYFIYDLKERKKANGFSIIGFISVLLTGGIGLLKLSPMVFAIKETAVPLIFGVAVVASLKTKKPLIRMMLYNPSVMDVDKVDRALDTEEKRNGFNKLMVNCTWIIAASFLVSATLNFFITRIVVTTDPNIDQAAFTAEIGRQGFITWIVLTLATLPLMVFAMYKLFKGIKELTGYGLEDVILDAKKDKKEAVEANNSAE